MENYELILMIAVGLALALFGYRVKKIAFFVIWFIIGYQLMTYFQPTLNTWVPQIADQPLWQTLLPIAGGLLLSLVGFSIEKLCVGGICFCLTMIIAVNYFGSEMQTLAIAAIIGVVLAGLAVTLIKPASIVATSIAGAYALTLAAEILFPEINHATMFFPILGGISAFGAIFQFITTKRLQ